MKFIKKIFPDKIKKAIKDSLGVPSLRNSLGNLKRCGFNQNFVLDVGAYTGEWTLEFLQVFPGKKVLMLEAQRSKEPILNSIVLNYANINYHIGLLGAEDGRKVFFYQNETASHVIYKEEELKEAYAEGHVIETIDSIIREGKYPLPDFIKIDVQGYELEVIKGAAECMKNCEVCLLEVSFIDLNGADPVILDVMNLMDHLNFQAYDISQLMRRPYDKALYQADIFFVKKSSKLLAYKGWN